MFRRRSSLFMSASIALTVGVVRTIDTVVNVLAEPPQNIGTIEKLKPSD